MRMSLLLVVLCSIVMTALPRCIDLVPGATVKIKLAHDHEWTVDPVAHGLFVELSKDKAGVPVKHVFAVMAAKDAKLGKYTVVFKTAGETKEFIIKVKAPKAKVEKAPKAKDAKAPHVKKAPKVSKPVVAVKPVTPAAVVPAPVATKPVVA